MHYNIAVRRHLLMYFSTNTILWAPISGGCGNKQIINDNTVKQSCCNNIKYNFINVDLLKNTVINTYIFLISTYNCIIVC